MIRSFAVVLITSAACTPQQAGKLGFAEAVGLCTERAVVFGMGRYGREAEEPPDNVVQDRYRACVYANSGAYPKGAVAWRRPPPTPFVEAIEL